MCSFLRSFTCATHASALILWRCWRTAGINRNQSTSASRWRVSRSCSEAQYTEQQRTGKTPTGRPQSGCHRTRPQIVEQPTVPTRPIPKYPGMSNAPKGRSSTSSSSSSSSLAGTEGTERVHRPSSFGSSSSSLSTLAAARAMSASSSSLSSWYRGERRRQQTNLWHHDASVDLLITDAS